MKAAQEWSKTFAAPFAGRKSVSCAKEAEISSCEVSCCCYGDGHRQNSPRCHTIYSLSMGHGPYHVNGLHCNPGFSLSSDLKASATAHRQLYQRKDQVSFTAGTVRERHTKTLREILQKGVYDSNPNKNDLASRWITEPGLYQLVFKSHLAFPGLCV